MSMDFLSCEEHIVITAAGISYSSEYNLTWMNWVECGVNVNAVTGSPVTPVLAITFETSVDGVNWNTLLTFSDINATASGETKANHRYQTPPILFGRKGRFKYDVSVASGTPGYTGSVFLNAGG